MRQIAHIVNPFSAEKSSGLGHAQSIVFETIRIAREFADGIVGIRTYSAQFSDDRSLVPEGFKRTVDLDRSILDIGTFKKARSLPLIKDILDRLYESTDAEYFIYTNVDVALMPYFYLSVNKVIDEGYDAFVINRRTIPDLYTSCTEIPLMYAEIGESHKGYDCFIFNREVYPKYKLGNVCIGMAWVGRALLANLFAYSTKFKEVKNKHFTFHVGNDQSWRDEKYLDYLRHNKSEYLKVFEALQAELGNFNSNVRSFLLDAGKTRQQLRYS